VMLYAIGRGFIESLRIDEAHHFFGLRLNVFTAIVVALGALAYIVISARRRPGREAPETLQPQHTAPPAASDGDAADPEPDDDAAVGADAGRASDAPGDSVDP